MPKLNNEQKEVCDRPITEEKSLKSIKNPSNGRTPGSDGLPADWYKYFWCDIKRILCDSIMYAIKKGELSTEQKTGNYNTVTTKRKNRLLLKKLVTNKLIECRLQDSSKNPRNENTRSSTCDY